MPSAHPAPPADAPISTVRHRVPFYETDGMGVVHHANYLRYLEVARIQLLDDHDVPYRDYLARDLHFAVTRADLRYRRGARYDDVVETTVWVEWVRGASLGIGYEIRTRGELLATALTEHAMVDASGRPRRIPRERRVQLAGLARTPPPPGT